MLFCGYSNGTFSLDVSTRMKIVVVLMGWTEPVCFVVFRSGNLL